MEEAEKQQPFRCSAAKWNLCPPFPAQFRLRHFLSLWGLRPSACLRTVYFYPRLSWAASKNGEIEERKRKIEERKKKEKKIALIDAITKTRTKHSAAQKQTFSQGRLLSVIKTLTKLTRLTGAILRMAHRDFLMVYLGKGVGREL